MLTRSMTAYRIGFSVLLGAMFDWELRSFARIDDRYGRLARLELARRETLS